MERAIAVERKMADKIIKKQEMEFGSLLRKKDSHIKVSIITSHYNILSCTFIFILRFCFFL
jgi:hypothetical protein